MEKPDNKKLIELLAAAKVYLLKAVEGIEVKNESFEVDKAIIKLKAKDPTERGFFNKIFKKKDLGPKKFTDGFEALCGDAAFYEIMVSFEDNLMFFTYRLDVSSNKDYYYIPMVNVDENGHAIFADANKLAELDKIEEEWNKNTRNLIISHKAIKGAGSPVYHYLSFEFFYAWNFNDKDKYDDFKNDFLNVLGQLFSDDAKKLADDTLKPYRTAGRL